MNLFEKIKRKWVKLRLQPIRVFCLHQVSDVFDENSMYRGDWMKTDDFKHAIEKLQKEGYIFISLKETYDHINNDWIRCSKYVALTADDGWASIRNILPWLNEQKIPITLFINPAYMDGKHFRERDTEKYLTDKEIQVLNEQYPLVAIGSHGWEHIDNSKMDAVTFKENFNKAKDALTPYGAYAYFYAYPNGRYSSVTDTILEQLKVCPLRADGEYNINDSTQIHREYLPECD